jgi:hypothetical protein
MPNTETFMVRFANRAAIQRFQEGRELIDEVLEESPWLDDLRRAKECFDEAWDGLSFGVEEK